MLKDGAEISGRKIKMSTRNTEPVEELYGMQSENVDDISLPDRPTVEEVARWLRKSPDTIYIWCRKGLIPHKVVGRSKMFDKARLIKWASEDER
jgi:Helix-turn-helix domain